MCIRLKLAQQDFWLLRKHFASSKHRSFKCPPIRRHNLTYDEKEGVFRHAVGMAQNLPLIQSFQSAYLRCAGVVEAVGAVVSCVWIPHVVLQQETHPSDIYFLSFTHTTQRKKDGLNQRNTMWERPEVCRKYVSSWPRCSDQWRHTKLNVPAWINRFGSKNAKRGGAFKFLYLGHSEEYGSVERALPEPRAKVLVVWRQHPARVHTACLFFPDRTTVECIVEITVGLLQREKVKA